MFKQSKLGSVVVLYNPPPEITSHIRSYIDGVDYLVIVDNSDIDHSSLFTSFPGEKIKYIPNKVNLGIATALNQGIEECSKRDCKWALTMDQDSFFEEDQLTDYLKCAEACMIANAGIFAPNTGTSSLTGTDCNYHLVETVITSGSIINIPTLIKLNGFDEKLFIDGVDDDICYRFRLDGKEVIYFPDVILHHNLGEPRMVRNFFGGKMVSRNLHSAIRLYYMVRNYYYLMSRYGELFPKKVPEYKRELLVKIKNGLLYDKNRFQVLKYIIKGYRDFKKNRFGKLVSQK